MNEMINKLISLRWELYEIGNKTTDQRERARIFETADMIAAEIAALAKFKNAIDEEKAGEWPY